MGWCEVVVKVVDDSLIHDLGDVKKDQQLSLKIL